MKLEVLLLRHGQQSLNNSAVCRQYDIHGKSDAWPWARHLEPSVLENYNEQ